MQSDPRALDQPRPAIEGQRILQIRLSNDLYEWLRAAAFYQRRSMNALVNEALDQFREQASQR